MMYDRGLHCYVNLLDILQAVKDGDEFVVTDSNHVDRTNQMIMRALSKLVPIPIDGLTNIVKRYYETE